MIPVVSTVNKLHKFSIIVHIVFVRLTVMMLPKLANIGVALYRFGARQLGAGGGGIGVSFVKMLRSITSHY